MKAVAPLVIGLNAIYLYVRDLDRSIDFYRGLLGIPIERHEGDADWAEATFPSGVRFALHRARPENVKGSGSVSIDLEVEDIDAAAERLREAGVEVNEIEREFWGSVFTVTDPDGYAIDIFQRPAGAIEPLADLIAAGKVRPPTARGPLPDPLRATSRMSSEEAVDQLRDEDRT